MPNKKNKTTGTKKRLKKKDNQTAQTKSKHQNMKNNRGLEKQSDENPKGALVIGGGITGIQAALDLAEAGIYTYIVERSPSIGGRMAQLDKTFPTNDCAMCILSPKLVTVARHPNIRLLTNSEVSSVSGAAGKFKVKITKHPRYIDENKCVGCGECAAKCPSKVPNEFDLGLGMRKAIYIPFPQAVPLVYSIDSENCLYLQKEKCGTCAKICKADAVDYSQKIEEFELDIGAIIVATGYDQYNPEPLQELGYGIFKDVITGLEFERMLNAAGPTNGKVVRLSDGKPPKNILFIQCVGSRDKHRAQEYCSRICCMYAIKEAMIAIEHQPDLKNIDILNMEIRAYGKGFEEYYLRAKAEGINFIHGRPAEINEDRKTGKLQVTVEDTESGVIKELQSDLVVLSSAVIPGKSNPELAKILNIDLDSHGFFKELGIDTVGYAGGSGVASSREGIFLSGCAQGPKDIPDSVSSGSAAAAAAEKFLVKAKVRSVKEIERKSEQPEEATTETGFIMDEPRIGVFVCHCGINIGGVLDVPQLVKYAKTLPDVVFAIDNLYTCSDDAQGLIQEKIKEHNLNRVIVASCTPRTHEPIFRDTCKRAGINPYLFEMANIRDQCSWVHMHDPEQGTEKAKDLIRMSVARAHHLQPLDSITTPIKRSALIIGGGIAGIQCALDLSSQGIETHLVEVEQQLGGRLNQLNTLAPTGVSPKKVIKEKVKQLQNNKVKIYTGAKLDNIEGYVGNFEVTLTIDQSSSKNRKGKKNTVNITTGAIILAIGSNLYDPSRENEYGYGKFDNIITNLELETKMNQEKLKLKGQKVAIIQCVGAREIHKLNGNQACSRYCCQTSLKQAVELQKAGALVTILHKGIRAFSKYAEELYYEASSLGVKFIRFPESVPPQVIKKGGKIKIFDLSLKREVILPTDLIVLSLAMAPNQEKSEQIQSWLKIPMSADGFFLELHPKLGPVETNTIGIYLCGCAQGPKDVVDTLNQASGAAAKVAALLSNDELAVEPITAFVDERYCWGCGTCEQHCPYGAASVSETETGERRSVVNTALCKGCGVCASNCPSGAITIRHFTNDQIFSMISAFCEVIE